MQFSKLVLGAVVLLFFAAVCSTVPYLFMDEILVFAGADVAI